MGARLLVFGEGQLIHSAEVSLQEGANRFTVPVEARNRLPPLPVPRLCPINDTRLQNNQASAFTVVHGPPRILIG
jgi:hypothetical protein